MPPMYEAPWNAQGIVHAKNKLLTIMRKHYPFARSVPLWAEYEAIKTTYPAYNALNAAFLVMLSTELMTIGLMRGQLKQGLVEGPLGYVHPRVHSQGDLTGDTDTYFNYARVSSVPALRKLPQVLIGHIADAAARVRAGVDHTNGVDIPFHKTLDEVFGDDKVQELRWRPSYPPDATFLYELAAPQNFAYIES